MNLPDADLRGWREASPPCLGAYEWEVEVTAQDSGGRVTRRWVAGRQYDYACDAQGRLTQYTDAQNPADNLANSYDHAGRRVFMTVGAEYYPQTATRMVYDGNDVVAEYVDEDNNGTVDRTRVYCILAPLSGVEGPDIDQRMGFVDIEGGQNHYYYYICDQVGTVLQVVDAAGNVKNQYDYDAFKSRDGLSHGQA